MIFQTSWIQETIFLEIMITKKLLSTYAVAANIYHIRD